MLPSWSAYLLTALTSAYGLVPPPESPDAFSVQTPYLYEGGLQCSVDNGCLALTDTTQVSDSDEIGPYSGTRNTYTTLLGTGFVTLEKVYDASDVTVYVTTFPDGVEGCDVGDKDLTCSGYPVFNLVGASEDVDFRFVTPGDNMVGWGLFSQGNFWSSYGRFRTGEDAGIAGFIIPDSYSLVISPLEQPMAVNNWLSVADGAAQLHYGVRCGSAQLHYGVEGLAGSVPAGFSMSVIATTGTGSPVDYSFTQTVLKWGGYVQQKFGVTKIEDITTQYLGYYTDNGAYYYYNDDQFDSYQDLLVGLHDYVTQQQIPIRYVQLDSWWYYKGLGDGVKNWTARPSVFPDGIEAMHLETGWPVVAHNRYFASDTDYAEQNGGKYPFSIDDSTQKAVPLDQTFWEDLFDEALGWGLQVYEQDWLDREYEGVSALHTNVTLGDTWLQNMAAAAAQRGLAVQYCMSLPRQLMHAAQEDAVTQIRVSDDYHLDLNQWKIGHTSLFAHALGLKPYKDVFWTSSDNINNPYPWCQTFQSSPGGTSTSYVGHVNVTESGAECVYWEDVDYRARYPFDSLSENFCRNPGGLHDRAFCFTDASLDINETLWTWEYCQVPSCDDDCYVRDGVNYVGDQQVTEKGYTCVDWNGFYGLTGAFCRNPNGTQDRPWCFVTPDYTALDFCDNKCPEAVEYNPALHSAVATLSGGPIGIGDKMENIDKDLVMKSVRADGKILRPGKPITAIDRYFLNDTKPIIWTTETTISSYTFGMIFVADVPENLYLSARDLNFENAMSRDFMYWKNYPYKGIFTFGNENSTIEIPTTDEFMGFAVMTTSPMFSLRSSRYAILGEQGKWVPASLDRIKEIIVDDDTFDILVEGYQNEEVVINFYQPEGSFSILFGVTCYFKNTTETSILRINVNFQTCTEE